MKLILASKSPRRIEFLEKWGFDFKTKSSDFKEKILKSPEETVIYNAYGKAKKVAIKFKNKTVIGADTVVALNKEIIGKPQNKKDLERMLQKISGKTHLVITGIALIKNNKFVTNICKTEVTFRRINDNEIKDYIRTGEGNDKAGGYAIQGLASDFIVKVDGLLDNVIGIPLMILRKMLIEIER